MAIIMLLPTCSSHTCGTCSACSSREGGGCNSGGGGDVDNDVETIASAVNECEVVAVMG